MFFQDLRGILQGQMEFVNSYMNLGQALTLHILSDHEPDIDVVKTEPQFDDDLRASIKMENIEIDTISEENSGEVTGETDEPNDDENEDSSSRTATPPAVTRRSPRIRENSVLREKQSTNGKKVESKARRKTNR